MTAARAAINNYCFKKSCHYILTKCNWLNINNMIIYSGITLTYKILTKKEPAALMMLYRKKNSNRNYTNWYTDYLPKTEIMNRFHTYRCLEYFYTLPKEIQNCKKTTFKKKLKLYLNSTTIALFDTHD